MVYKEFTKCVKPYDYEQPPTYFAHAIGFGFLSPGGVLPTLKEYLDHCLDGKLICLRDGVPTDVCAIGTVLSFDTVEEKRFPDQSIDNDFGINLMLWPMELADFIALPDMPKAQQLKQFIAFSDSDENKLAHNYWFFAQTGPQGWLVKPLDYPSPEAASNYGHPKEISWSEAEQVGGMDPAGTVRDEVKVDVLHCEVEGSRMSDLRDVIDFFQSPIGVSKFCKIWVIGWIACMIGGVVFTPVIWSALSIAWFAASDGNPDDARTDPEAGEIKPGDLIIVNGRWVQDADPEHGWNELHPVKAIQQLKRGPRPPVFGGAGGFSWGAHDVPADAWTRLFCEVPPVNVTQTGSASSGLSAEPGMTPEQDKVYRAQLLPENGWLIHPLIDGCLPTGAAPRRP